MSRKCASTPCIFGTPTTCQGGQFWHEMSTLAPLSDLSYNAVGPIFRTLIHNGSVKKKCQVSALYLIPVKFGIRFKMAKSPICPAIAQSSNFAGMQLKFDWTNLHEFFTRYSVVNSPSAVWVTPYPLPHFFGRSILIF